MNDVDCTAKLTACVVSRLSRIERSCDVICVLQAVVPTWGTAYELATNGMTSIKMSAMVNGPILRTSAFRFETSITQSWGEIPY